MRVYAFWLSLILIFTIPWDAMIDIGDLGTTGARVVGLSVAVFWIFTVVITGRFRKPHLFHIMFFLFVLWNTASILWSIDTDKTVTSIVTYIQLIGLVYILWDLYKSPIALNAGLQAYILGAYVSIGGTIINYLTGIEESYLRYAATGFNANDLGLTLALGIPVAWYLAVSKNNSKLARLFRLVNYGYIPAAILSILLTASRGSLVAAMPALLYIVVSFSRINIFQRVLILTALIIVLFALQSLVPQSSLQRLATTGISITKMDNVRVNIWREGIATFLEYPLFGVGSGAFRTGVESGRYAHNTFLSILVEVGMIGFVIFFITLVAATRQFMRQSTWNINLWLTIFLVWLLGLSVATWEHRKQTWLFLGLAVVSAGLSVYRNEPATQIPQKIQHITGKRTEKSLD